MNKIINIKQAIKIGKQLRSDGKKIVLIGGIFDILHVGHIGFIKKAKKQGDYLFILLESDEKAQATKGKNRPINSQKERAQVLSALASVDYIVLLPNINKDQDYDNIISQIKPSIIATTYKDPNIKHKERQAKQIGSKVVYVIKAIKGASTSSLAKLIEAGS